MNIDISGRTFRALDLNEHFVLSGRGSQNYKWAGNLRMRDVTALYLDAYIMSNTQGEKTQIINEIVRRLSSMIFVRGTKNNQCWMTLTKKEARTKVSHAMRDLVGKRKRQKRHQVIAMAPAIKADQEATTEEEEDEEEDASFSCDDTDDTSSHSVNSSTTMYLPDIVDEDVMTAIGDLEDISWFMGPES